MEAMVDEVEEEDEVEEYTGIKDNMDQRMVRSYPYQESKRRMWYRTSAWEPPIQ
jgi:hypothetical protein